MRTVILALSIFLNGQCVVMLGEDAALLDGNAEDAGAVEPPLVAPPAPRLLNLYEPIRREPPRFIVTSDSEDAEVSIVPPIGDAVRACTSGRCEQAEWYAGVGGYTIVIDAAGAQHSAELMLHGDELAIEAQVSSVETRIDIQRPPPPGVSLERGPDWGRRYSGDGWAPFTLRNASQLEWSSFAFGRTLHGRVERLDSNGHWRFHMGVDCAFGSRLVEVTPGSVWSAGGQGALALASEYTPRGRYRFVVRVPLGHYPIDGVHVHTWGVVAYEVEIDRVPAALPQ